MENKITTDICIIGAGPVGLFAVFEAGLLKMRCHIIDVLPQVGGQLSEIYPQKPIYDIPGFPVVNAQTLVENLMEQIAPFKPTFSLGEKVEELIQPDEHTFFIKTNEGTTVEAKAVVIAAGLGCFEPRKPSVKNLAEFEGKGVNYFVKNPELYRNKEVVIAGGGDSALDWTIFLSDVAAKVTLVHRSDSFRGAPDSVEKVFALAEAGKINLVLQANITALEGYGHLQNLEIGHNDGRVSHINADFFIPLFGLTPKLGPIAEWGLNLNSAAIEVNTEDYSTNIPGIYAIGDINTYPGKLKLILCGFHEAALMAQTAYHRVYPDKKLTFKYTTVMALTNFELKVKDRNGDVKTLQVPADAEYNVMEVLKTLGYKMRATCGGMGLCADCHCQILEGMAQLPTPTDQELETLDEIPDATFKSRLSCQIKPGEYLNGVCLHLMGSDHY